MNRTGRSSSSSGDATAGSSPAAFHPALLRKLITVHLDGEKDGTEAPNSSNPAVLTNEAAEVLGELLKLFVMEARNRASLEAEVEQEVQTSNDKDDDDDGGSNTIYVRSDHCSKIGSEMLMDFS